MAKLPTGTRKTDPKKRPAAWSLEGLLGQVRSYWIAPQEIRSEAWALGGRHRGEVLTGARLESDAPDVSFERSILLKAVIRSESIAARSKLRLAKSRSGSGRP